VGKAGRAGSAVLVVVVLAGLLVAGIGSGYAITKPLLGDGSAYLAKGHTVVRVNGETGRPDAEAAQQLATGSEQLQTVRLPDGRIAVVNKTTGAVSVIDASTMSPTGPAATQAAPTNQIEAVATASDGYLVNSRDNTVAAIATPGRSAVEPVKVSDGIAATVSSGDSVWVLTGRGDVVEVNHGQASRTVRLGEPAVGLTVADGHPVALTGAGQLFVVDGEQPRGIGELGLSGPDVVLGSFRGAGRQVVGVDRKNGRFAALDPRTGKRITVALHLAPTGAQLAAPVVLSTWAYVPDYAGPTLWRINLATATADAKPLEVPGQPGPFAIEVSGERVWANSQYDRRLLVVDAGGHERYADKGAGSDVADSQAQTSGGGQNPVSPPATGGATTPAINPATIPAMSPPTTPVTVPSLPKGANKEQACAALESARLRCRAVAVGDNGRPTGEVVGMDPPGGTKVQEHSLVTVRYVGPLKTPALLGLNHTEACRLVEGGNRFSCTTRVDPAPVVDPAQLGVVTAQDPQPGTPLERGGRVQVTYSESIALPSLAGQTQGEACARLAKYQMSCDAVQGDPGVGPGHTPGTVYQQNPAAGTVARVGATVRVVFYSGRSTVGNYIGLTWTDACAQAQAAGFACSGVEGRTAAGSGAQPGTVYQQDPPPGTVADLGQKVTVTYYSGSNDVPNYVGAAADAACGDLRARGFGCNPVAQPYPSVNRVEQQDEPAGRYPLGSVITIHYSPWAPVQYSIYQKNDEDVWALRQTGDVPAGYGRQAFVVGSAYPANTPSPPFPEPQNINGFFCTAGGGRCNGLNTNHFYSRATSYGDPQWHGPNPIAIFVACHFGGRPIYRTWNAGSPTYYKITDTPGGAAGVELLGCVW
jgi:beta-lactam-binding protein with PASTA domain